MKLFADNIRYLRTERGKSQNEVAESLMIQRDRYSKYEGDKSDPPLDILQKISRYFHVSIDILLTVDLRKIPLEELLKMVDNRILLPIKTDDKGRNLIEIVPHKARMGYASGYADPEFIESLPTFSLPILGSGKFRAFPGEGDSMPPHRDSSFIIGEYVERLSDVKDGKTYILVTHDQGIVYKRLNRSGKYTFNASSNNVVYAPYEVKFSDVLEIWRFVASLEMEEFETEEFGETSVKGMFSELLKELRSKK